MFGNLVPLLNPIRVAEEYAMLDCMSGGRLIAGLLRGVATRVCRLQHSAVGIARAG